ncbi:MAG: hypothetical protein CML29_00110 [Rhizobiales bacterium]|nr:hypothetical protein [Hyphomicrobiales bacterium]MBA70691.1 hypothetical protein [Hyphomicrobiales bacterium]|tara:strand:+ start:815 stop:2614 length:1800 start_codon:yes stop_codon:yes gene_type:complete
MRSWLSEVSRGSASAAERDEELALQQVLILCHSDDPVGIRAMNNLCAGLDFSRIEFVVTDIQRLAAWPSLDAFSVVVLSTSMLSKVSPDRFDAIRAFVEKGGGLVAACRLWHPKLAGLFGLPETKPALSVSEGLVVRGELFPGLASLHSDIPGWNFRHSRIPTAAGSLPADCDVLADDGDGQPVLWMRDVGEGRVFYWNTASTDRRVLRGLVLQTVLGASGCGVGAIGAFAIFQIDDFPPSLSDEIREPVAREYPGVDQTEFLFDIWHRDMLALKRKHDLRFTYYAIANYFDIDTAPGADLKAPAVRSGAESFQVRFKRSLGIAADDELGFHGYNHEPLIADHWPDLEVLHAKLEIARKIWLENAPGGPPRSWVPANNWFQASHIATLAEVFPEIGIVCSLAAAGHYRLGEQREFGPEPWHPSLLGLPRQTFGYVATDRVKLAMLSQIAAMGVWSHFIHPDDVYDVPSDGEEADYQRNAEWRFWRQPNESGLPGLFNELDAWLTEARALFPWLEFVTTSEGAERYRDHMANEVEVRHGNDRVLITSTSGGDFYLRTRADTDAVVMRGGRVLDRRNVSGGALHVVRCDPGAAEIRLTGKS